MRRGCGQTTKGGAYAYQRLKLRRAWEGSRGKGQGFKPDLGKPAVRDYRGASGNVATVEMRTQLAIERAGLVTLHLSPARRSSIPTAVRSLGISALQGGEVQLSNRQIFFSATCFC